MAVGCCVRKSISGMGNVQWPLALPSFSLFFSSWNSSCLHVFHSYLSCVYHTSILFITFWIFLHYFYYYFFGGGRGHEAPLFSNISTYGILFLVHLNSGPEFCALVCSEGYPLLLLLSGEGVADLGVSQFGCALRWHVCHIYIPYDTLMLRCVICIPYGAFVLHCVFSLHCCLWLIGYAVVSSRWVWGIAFGFLR